MIRMHVSIITDCCDANAITRQTIRSSTLFDLPSTVIGINPLFDVPSDLEASGHLIDALDAGEKRPNIILVNKAPRSGSAKKRSNGTPFGYFWYGKTLVCCSVDGHVLSLPKKLGILNHINVFDIPTVMDFCMKKGLIDHNHADHIINTQFRSYEFLPRVAKWIWDGYSIPCETQTLDHVPDAGHRIWFVDIFGNCKTTILPEEVQRSKGQKYLLGGYTTTATTRLKDLPNDEGGLVIGSSGIQDYRRCEIMIQGKSASDTLGLTLGDEIILSKA